MRAEEDLAGAIALHGKPVSRVRRVTDTTDFFALEYGDVLALDGGAYQLYTHMREGRFGIDDEPKHWVRRAVDLDSGRPVVVKLEFHEHFTARFGAFAYECARSPRKEALILDLMRGHSGFMQGTWADDSKGNCVRVLEFVRGQTLDAHIARMGRSHEEYYRTCLPGVLRKYVGLMEALGSLHEYGQTHGDVRRDHVIVEPDSGGYVWIDFDYMCTGATKACGYDLAGLGNLLVHIVGRGDVTVQDIQGGRHPGVVRLDPSDMGIVFRNRVVNLRKVYPYVSSGLNSVCMRFGQGASVYYDTVQELIEDLGEAMEGLSHG